MARYSTFAMTQAFTRRDAMRIGAGGLVAGVLANDQSAVAQQETADSPAERPFLTPAKDFRDVSRGTPLPHTLKGDALVNARLTPETWRLEIVAEEQVALASPKRLDDNTAIDFAALLDVGKAHGVRFLKAMQCNNIPLPLGQGLWEGVPLRDLLALCGPIDNARRLFYWGFHNNDPKQLFRSSLAINQVFDTPPGELPPFVAYRLNGEPIPLVRGGPVRMVVPWAHGFKSIKWLQKIVLTNDYQANDTYAEKNNDPESNLKTAAYFEDLEPEKFADGQPITVRGTAMVGWPGIERVEYWLRPDGGTGGKLADSDAAWGTAIWKPGTIDPPPQNWRGALPDGLLPKDIWGFTTEGQPKEWPLRYSIAHWTLSLNNVPAGKYELRVRTIDKNGFGQPLPRSGQKSGRNLIQCKLIAVG